MSTRLQAALYRLEFHPGEDHVDAKKDAELILHEIQTLRDRVAKNET